MMLRNFIALIGTSIVFLSCNSDTNTPDESLENGLINLKEVFDDQWRIKKDQPFVLLKTITYDDKVDSSFVNQDSVLFYQLSDYFIKADISNPDFISQYDYSESYDNASGMVFLHYIAKDPKSYTQKLELTMDRFTSKLLNVYVETQHNSFFNDKSQKLLYSADKGFFIQEYEKRIFSDPKKTVLNYYYKY